MEEVVADRRSYSPQQGLRLPRLSRDLEIAYSALSFVAPQKVRFRYKLESRDASWQEAGTRRQAFYTDLRPGNYRFRVIFRLYAIESEPACRSIFEFRSWLFRLGCCRKLILNNLKECACRGEHS